MPGFLTKPLRRRGRPRGTNRVPLNIIERRARNAQYERERREETAAALRELAEAAGLDPNMSQSQLLRTVISYVARRNLGSDAATLRRQNEKLMAQIVDLLARLSINEPVIEEPSSSSSLQGPANTPEEE